MIRRVLAAADAVRLTGVDVEVFFEGETTPFGSGLTTLTGDVLGVSDVFGTAAPGSVIVTCVAAPAGYTFNKATTNPGTPVPTHPAGAVGFDCFRNTVADLVTNRFPMFFDFNENPPMPPILTKVFDPDATLVDQPTTLTFTVDNTANATPTKTIKFTDELPGPVVVATLPNVSTTCGGTLTAPPGGNQIELSDGEVDTGSTCSISIDVVSDQAGEFTNTTSDLDSDKGGSAPAVDELRVLEPVPVGFAKTFSPDVVGAGALTTLTFDLENSLEIAATDVKFVDDLPAGLTVATPNGFATDCVGGTLVAAPGGSTIEYSDGGIPAKATCSISVSVINSGTGSYVNTTGDLTSNLGNSGTSTDTLTVIDPPAFSQTFSPDSIAVGSTTTLTYTIDNAAAGTVSAIGFTDTLPTGLSATATPVVSDCGGTATASGSDVSLAGGALAAATSCTIEVEVQATTEGLAVNTTSPLSTSVGDASAATDTLRVVQAPGFGKAFSPATINEGGVSTLTFTIDNSASSFSATAVSFDDTLPAGLIVATPSEATTTCAAGTVTAADASGTVDFSGGVVTAGTTCTVSVAVTAASAGTYDNTSSTLASSLGAAPAATATLTVDLVLVAPGFSKAFAPTTIDVGGISTLTFTIDNGANGAPATGLGFVDDLPVGLEVAGTPNASTTCTGGTLTATVGATSVSYSGGSAATSSSCTISVDVTGTTSGTKVNTTGALASSVGSGPAATATLQVNDVITPPLFSKAFTPATINEGGSSTLTFTIDNSANATAATGASFTDALPGNVTFTGNETSTGCLTSTGNVTTSNTLGWSGSVAGGAVCTYSQTVSGPTAGTFDNLTSDLTSSHGNSGTAAATLTVVAVATPVPPTFTKAFSPASIPEEGTSTLTFTIDNSGSTADATDLTFSDTLPAGMVVATPSGQSKTCTGGMLGVVGTDTVDFAGGSVLAGQTCTIQTDVTAAAAGTYPNATTDLTSSLGTSDAATATLTVTAVAPGFAKEFDQASIAVGGVSTLTFTIDNTANVAATDLAFTDVFPAGLVVASPANTSSTCAGTVTAISGAGSIVVSGGDVPPAASCTVSVDTTTDVVGTFDNTSGPLTSSLGTTPAATATISATAVAPGFTKTFAPDTITEGGESTLTFTIDNSSNGAPALGLSFTDVIPAGLSIASPTGQTTTCTGGMLDATASPISFSGGSVAAGASCTVSVDVVGDTANTYDTTSSELTTSFGTSAAASATLTVAPAAAALEFTPGPNPNGLEDPYVCGEGFVGIISGGTGPFTLTYTISNAQDTIALGSFVVATAGDFTSPAGFIDYGTVPAATYDVSIQLVDSGTPPGTLNEPNLFSALITDDCGTTPTTDTTVPPNVDPNGELPATGSRIRGTLVLAGLLMLLGAALLTRRRPNGRAFGRTGTA